MSKSMEAKIKGVLFVATSLAIAMALALGAGGCHRANGPELARSDGGGSLPRQQAALEGGKDKGKPSLAGASASKPPPAVGSEPRQGDRPITMPYHHDGERIDRSAASGAASTDLGPAAR
jgi:hypothetical protein